MSNIVRLPARVGVRPIVMGAGAVGVCVAICVSAFGIASPAAAQDNRTVYEYDGLGRLVKESRPAEGSDTIYTYDALGNRLSAVETLTVTASFGVDNASVSEGGALTFTVTKSGATTLSHDVSYATANGSASSNDYQAASGTLTFAQSETTKTVTVQTTNDAVYENNETLFVNLSNPTNGASMGDAQGVGTINDNDSPPSFAINNVSQNEGDSLTFTVTKNGGSAFTHNVNYATANGTAVAPGDYTAKSGTLSFAPSETSKMVTIASIEDADHEGDETFSVNLSAATGGATISDAQGIGTIINDDPVNSPPIAVNDSVSGDSLLTHTVFPLANDSDPNGHPLTLTGYTRSSTSLTVSWNASQKRMSISGPVGTFYIDYTISDGNGGTDSARINVELTPGSGGCADPPCLPDL